MNRVALHLKQSFQKNESCGRGGVIEPRTPRLEVKRDCPETVTVQGIPSRPTCLAAVDVADAMPPAGSERVAKWIGEITEAWRTGVGHTLQLARMISVARDRMPRGEWAAVWKSGKMPFSKSKGEMLVAIGDRLSWVSVQTFAHLPAGWSILYQLARLDRQAFEQLLKAGAIHPKLTLQEAKSLLADSSSDTRSNKEDAVQRRLRLFRDFIYRNVIDWRPEVRKMVSAELERLLHRINGDVQGGAEHDSQGSLPNCHTCSPETPS
jgi:hypothetical protein